MKLLAGKNSRKQLINSLLLNSMLVTFILLSCINALLFSVLYINFNTTEENYIRKNLDEYRHQYNITENSAITKSNYMIQNLNFIDLLNSVYSDTYNKYETATTMYYYIRPFIDENVKSITVFTGNRSLFTSEYVKDINLMDNYGYICEKLSENGSLFIDKAFSKDPEGRLYFSLYRKININFDTIMQINMYLPKTHGAFETILITENISDFGRDYLSVPLSDNWYAVSCKNHKTSQNQRMFYIVLFAFFEAALLALSFYITKKINQKTVSSVKQLVEYASLNYSDSPGISFLSESSEYQEIEQIKNSIKALIIKIQKISTEKAAIELEKKDISLKLLQSKLNPHFLYNILSVISYKEFKNNNSETYKIINELIAYYRMILSKGKEVIALKEELELIRKYVFLAEISHSKHYELVTDIDPDMETLIIPHMLLQPFIENSIVHGLSGSRENCRITVKGRTKENFAVFTVHDNGYGMEESVLMQMNNIPESQNNYGIKNTYERMLLKYGHKASISYRSIQDVFTEAVIKIPYIKE